MKINSYVTKYSTNSYFLSDNGEAIIIDPGDNYAFFDKILQRENLTPLAVLITHGHTDHITACADFFSRGVKIYITDDDKSLIKKGRLFCGCDSLPFESESITDGQILHFPFVKLRVLKTPGHTEGGVCFIDEEQKIIFSGDTLFDRAVGRTDFPSGDQNKLIKSLKKLTDLVGDYTLFPGHGRQTTLAAAREFLNKTYLNDHD